VTDDLTRWVASRVAIPAALSEDLFEEPGRAGLIDLLVATLRQVVGVAGLPPDDATLPVLARYLDLLCAQWQATVEELALRLGADTPELASSLNDGNALGRVVRIRSETGDRHRHGRQVLVLDFDSGATLVYKPRDVGPDAALGQFLHWLSQDASLPEFRTPALLRRTGYGWTEFIETEPAATPADELAFWQRTGGLLAVLDLLNARDCHWQNVIAAGEQPALVDAEGLFHRELFDSDEATEDPEDTRALSVLSTGMTPYWKRAGDARREASGGGTPSPERIDSVLAGFEEVYRALMDRRSMLLDPGGPLSSFNEVRVRTIFRHTAVYQARMRDSLGAEYLACPDAHDAALTLPETDLRDPRMADVEHAELAALRRLDVPRFTVRVAGTAIDLDGREIPAWFRKTGLELVHERVRDLDERALARKLDYLRAAYALAALEDSFRRRPSSTT
jgi:lantibiotic modifying enzyme